MRKYVIGFALDEKRENILLIKKNRPEWQAGFFNGIGGKIEFDEEPINAMVREFVEECGIQTDIQDWNQFAVLQGEDFEIFVFYHFSDKLNSYKTITDEEVFLLPINNLYKTNFQGCISNISWLVGQILDEDLARINSVVNYKEK